MHCTSFGPLTAAAHTDRIEEAKGLNSLEDPVIKELATKYGKTPAQIILNHINHLGVSVIPKTAKTTRLAENFDWYDFKLTDEEYTKINGLNKNIRIYDFSGMAELHHFPIFY